MLTKRVMLVAGTVLTAVGAALVGPGAASPAAAVTQGSCKSLNDAYAFYASCTTVPYGMQYFAWADCYTAWGFGATEPGNSGVTSFADCPGSTELYTGGVNFTHGSCPVFDGTAAAVVSCTGLPDNLK